jgi:hypothetical protein
MWARVCAILILQTVGQGRSIAKREPGRFHPSCAKVSSSVCTFAVCVCRRAPVRARNEKVGGWRTCGNLRLIVPETRSSEETTQGGRAETRRVEILIDIGVDQILIVYTFYLWLDRSLYRCCYYYTTTSCTHCTHGLG